MNSHGYLVISLDFELIWGIFDSVNGEEKSEYFRKTLDVIPEVLDLFQKNNVHATWATVGMLFNENWEQWNLNKPDTLPTYKNEELAAYNFGIKASKNRFTNYFFAPELIKKIAKMEGQELGTHTYSHYYCQEEGQTLEQFEADLVAAIAMAKSFQIELKSLVFPRNQIQEGYLKICKKHGIQNVRSNPKSWYWKDPNSTSIAVKLARTGDAYYNFGKKSYPLEKIKPNELPLQHPASRFLRPVENNAILRRLKIERIKKEMENAASNNEVYHLWWHPHNFGDQPEESLKDLMEIIRTYKKLNEKYKFQSVNMMELGDIVLNKI